MKKQGYLFKVMGMGMLAALLMAGCQPKAGAGGTVSNGGQTSGSTQNPAALGGNGFEPVEDSVGRGTDASREETWEPVDWMQGGYQMPRGVRGHRECSCVNTYVLDIPEPEFAYAKKDWRFYTSLGGDFYVLDRYAMNEARDENPQYRYQLYWLAGRRYRGEPCDHSLLGGAGHE